MEEQGLVVVKENFLTRIVKSIKKFFALSPNTDGELMLSEENPNMDIIFGLIKGQNIERDVPKQILEARSAYRKYTINSNKEIGNKALSLVLKKIQENEEQIKKIIEINEENFTYEDIVSVLKQEINNNTLFNKKEDNNYITPVGVIGIESVDSKATIQNIFKSISTRNSIILLQNTNNEYSTEALILMIVKECLSTLYIDNKIIQMVQNDGTIEPSAFDMFIDSNGNIQKNNANSKIIYIYQDCEGAEEWVSKQISRIEEMEEYKGYIVKPIKGNFADVIKFLDNNPSKVACIYTKNKQRAKKFSNWVNADGVFINTDIEKFENKECDNTFFKSKFVVFDKKEDTTINEQV